MKNVFEYIISPIILYILVKNHMDFSFFSPRDMFGCLRPGKKSRREKEANKLLQDEYLKLGPIRWGLTLDCLSKTDNEMQMATKL